MDNEIYGKGGSRVIKEKKLAFSTARMCARIPMYVDIYVYRGLDCVTVLTGAR